MLIRCAEKYLDRPSEGSCRFFNTLLRNVAGDFQPHQLLSLYVTLKLLIDSTEKIACRLLESDFFLPDKSLVLLNSFILERNTAMRLIISDPARDQISVEISEWH